MCLTSIMNSANLYVTKTWHLRWILNEIFFLHKFHRFSKIQHVYWLLDFYLQKFHLQLLSFFYYANFSSSYHDIDPDKEENGVHEKWLVENDFYKLLLIHSRFEILLMNLEKGCSQSRSNISEIQVWNLLTRKRLAKY